MSSRVTMCRLVELVISSDSHVRYTEGCTDATGCTSTVVTCKFGIWPDSYYSSEDEPND